MAKSKSQAKKGKYQRYRDSGRLERRKDRNVLVSSHGAFKTVKELELHRKKVSKPVKV